MNLYKVEYIGGDEDVGELETYVVAPSVKHITDTAVGGEIYFVTLIQSNIEILG